MCAPRLPAETSTKPEASVRGNTVGQNHSIPGASRYPGVFAIRTTTRVARSPATGRPERAMPTNSRRHYARFSRRNGEHSPSIT